MIKVRILGCGSALPTFRHNPSAQLVEIRDKFFIVDCGEGTQMALRKTHVHFQRTRAIFISHSHGDHCLGLVGILSSFGLLGRIAPLHIYAPQDLCDLLPKMLDVFCQNLTYQLELHPLETKKQQVIYEDRSLSVETIPLSHRVPCCGFLFREKQTRNMVENNIEGLSYAYCSDTRYMPHLHEVLKGVNCLYHEATYAEDKADNAKKYWHSTARQAAQVANDSGVGTLLLGHFSQRYDSEEPLLKEAKEIFANTLLANEGMVWEVRPGASLGSNGD